MDGLGHLLALYTGAILFNLVLAAALWWRQRDSLSLALIIVWVAGLTSLVIQGALSQGGAFVITLGYSSTFLTTLALARLLAELTELSLPWRRYAALLPAGLGISFAASKLQAPFWAVALPTSLCLSWPLLHTVVRALRQGEVALSTTGKAFLVVGFAFVLHTLDFPFLRPHPSMAAAGFTIAMALVIALSVTGLAVVLERVAGERTRLAELEALKSRFFANISHELRTPLTLILSPLQTLLDDPDAQAFRPRLSLAQRSASRLLRLIDDILDLSKLEAGALRLSISSVDIRALAERIVEAHVPNAEERGQSLRVEVEADCPSILGDAHRLEIILTNLVGNATKYVPEGGHIVLSARSTPTEVILQVKDDGPGIPPDRQHEVFNRFVQGSRSSAGVGIGLALARELAELHGGELTLQSALGQGTTFTLKLLRGEEHLAAHVEAEASAAAVSTRPSLTSIESEEAALALHREPSGVVRGKRAPIRLEGGRMARIVVAEDDPDLRAFIVSVLSEEAEVQAEPDGRAALARVRRDRPDLVLTDVMMPHMTGKELCRALKSDPETRDLPVLMLTARAGVEAAIEGFDAGADDFVAKPFHPGVLKARVRSHLTVRQLALQLADQARLATAGSLAAGVAHEVRNPLNAVSNAAQVLAQLDGSGAAPGELLSVITDGATRISSVIDALDIHARPADGLEARPCNLQQGIVSTLRLLQHQAGDISVDVQGAEGREVWVPARAFHQVLTNLLDNALRAAESRVAVFVEETSAEVLIRVDDDGAGVPHEHAQRVFDPFFTTREVGQGRGLGLFVSRRLARESGGDLWVERAPLGGARFVLRLPRVADSLVTQELAPRPMETLRD